MKGIAVADIHTRASNPQFRIDSYPIAILNKVKFIVKTANKYRATIFIAGDIFHNLKVSYKYTNQLIRILRKAKYGIYTVPGQHDQEHHEQDMTPTPYQNLIEAGVITDVNGKCINGICGIGWEGVSPTISNDVAHSILIMHYCVTDGTPPFFLKKSAKSSTEIIKQYSKYSHIICGDYHVPHIKRIGDQLCINCGAIGRSNKDQYNHKPRIVLFDTDRPGKYKIIYVPIEPPEKVFNIPVDMEVDDTFSDQIKELAEELSNKSKRPSFTNTVKILMNKSNAPSRQINIAQKFINIGRE